MSDVLYMVIPCYNEEEVLPETSKQLKKKLDYLISLNKIDKESRIIFVDDGSKDTTWSIIQELHKSKSIFSACLG